MKISVIICTYNRRFLLIKLLRSLINQTLSSNNFEIIVINNGSDDLIQKEIENFKKQTSTNIRYYKESILGLSHARNAGLNLASYDIVAFIDDDAVADKFWLAELIKTYSTEEIIAVGGNILPIETFEQDIEIPSDLYLFLVPFKYKSNTIVHSLFGGNMSFRKSVFIKSGKFLISLGRSGNCRMAGEENHLFNIIKARHLGKVIYNPKAIVYHPAYCKYEENYQNRFCGGISSSLIYKETKGVRKYKDLLKSAINLCFHYLKYLLISKNDNRKLNSLRLKMIYYETYFIALLFGKDIMCINCKFKE
jgi:glucosyl-dolichyl phosphate glucuronosyltransferase